MLTLKVKEEIFGTDNGTEYMLEFSNNSISVQDLISIKVTKNIEDINSDLKKGILNHNFRSKEETELNKDHIKRKYERLKNTVFLDVEEAVYNALAGFQKNTFFIIVDGIQLEKLEQKLSINEKTDIKFIRLTPLIGG